MLCRSQIPNTELYVCRYVYILQVALAYMAMATEIINLIANIIDYIYTYHNLCGHALNMTMLLLKVHKGHLNPQLRTYGYPKYFCSVYYTSVPHFILPFRSVKYTPPVKDTHNSLCIFSAHIILLCRMARNCFIITDIVSRGQTYFYRLQYKCPH